MERKYQSHPFPLMMSLVKGWRVPPGRYDTPLPDEHQAAFAKDAAQDDRLWNNADYDVAGWWLSQKENERPTVPEHANAHFSDQWKKPNHITFSRMSQYSGRDAEGNKVEHPLDGGPLDHIGGIWEPRDNGTWNFSPHSSQIDTPEKQQKMLSYFSLPNGEFDDGHTLTINGNVYGNTVQKSAKKIALRKAEALYSSAPPYRPQIVPEERKFPGAETGLPRMADRPDISREPSIPKQAFSAAQNLQSQYRSLPNMQQVPQSISMGNIGSVGWRAQRAAVRSGSPRETLTTINDPSLRQIMHHDTVVAMHHRLGNANPQYAAGRIDSLTGIGPSSSLGSTEPMTRLMNELQGMARYSGSPTLKETYPWTPNWTTPAAGGREFGRRSFWHGTPQQWGGVVDPEKMVIGPPEEGGIGLYGTTASTDPYDTYWGSGDRVGEFDAGKYGKIFFDEDEEDEDEVANDSGLYRYQMGQNKKNRIKLWNVTWPRGVYGGTQQWPNVYDPNSATATQWKAKPHQVMQPDDLARVRAWADDMYQRYTGMRAPREGEEPPSPSSSSKPKSDSTYGIDFEKPADIFNQGAWRRSVIPFGDRKPTGPHWLAMFHDDVANGQYHHGALLHDMQRMVDDFFPWTALQKESAQDEFMDHQGRGKAEILRRDLVNHLMTMALTAAGYDGTTYNPATGKISPPEERNEYTLRRTAANKQRMAYLDAAQRARPVDPDSPVEWAREGTHIDPSTGRQLAYDPMRPPDQRMLAILPVAWNRVRRVDPNSPIPSREILSRSMSKRIRRLQKAIQQEEYRPRSLDHVETTKFYEEAARPHYAGTMAREAEEGETPDFVDDGVGYMFPEDVHRPDLLALLQHQMGQQLQYGPGELASAFKNNMISPNAIRRGVRASPAERGPGSYFASVIMPRSLRGFLRKRGYSDSKIDEIIADNYQLHAADQSAASQLNADMKEDEVYRRPVYIFDPHVHKRMMEHLDSTARVFGDGGTSTPIEKAMHLIGTMSIDTDTGTPFVHVTDAIKDQSEDTAVTGAVHGFNNYDTAIDVNKALRKTPHAFEIGFMHSHPPGSSSRLSGGDQTAAFSLGLMHPYNLVGVHSASTIHVPPNHLRSHIPSTEPEFLSGPERNEYLARRATRLINASGRNIGLETTEPYIVRSSRDWEEASTGFYSGWHGALEPPAGALPGRDDNQDINQAAYRHPGRRLGFREVVTNHGPRVTSGTQRFPSQIQFLGQSVPPNLIGSAHRIGVETRPAEDVFGHIMWEDSNYPDPASVRSNLLVGSLPKDISDDDRHDKIEDAEGAWHTAIMRQPSATTRLRTPIPSSPVTPNAPPPNRPRPPIIAGPKAAAAMQTGGTSPRAQAAVGRIRELQSSGYSKSLRRLKKALLQKGQLRTTTYEDEIKRPEIVNILADEVPSATDADFTFDPFENGNGAKHYVMTDISKDRHGRRLPTGIPFPRAREATSVTYFGGYTKPPVVLPYGLREFFRRAGMKDADDYTDRVIDDNRMLQESDNQHLRQQRRATPYTYSGMTEEEEAAAARQAHEDKTRAFWSKYRQDEVDTNPELREQILEEREHMIAQLAMPGYDRTFADQRSYSMHPRRPAYVFMPGVYEDLINHLNTAADVFHKKPGRSKPDRTPKEQAAYMIGTHLIDPESGVPWVLVTRLWKHPEGYSDTHSVFTATGEMLDDMKDNFDARPHEYVVGHAHAHPPGSEPVPSAADVTASSEFEGTPGLLMIHTPASFFDHNGNIIHGDEAKKYLEDNALQGTMGRAGPPVRLTRTAYGHNNTVGYEPYVSDVVGSSQAVTNAYNTSHLGSFPVTHAFFGRQRMPAPANVTVLSGNIGTTFTTPATYGQSSLPSPSNARSKEIIDRIMEERGQPKVEISSTKRTAALPPTEIGLPNRFPINLQNRFGSNYGREGARQYYDPKTGQHAGRPYMTGFFPESEQHLLEGKSLSANARRLGKALVGYGHENRPVHRGNDRAAAHRRDAQPRTPQASRDRQTGWPIS